MNRDFALRFDPKYQNAATANIWDAVYMHPTYTSPHSLLQQSSSPLVGTQFQMGKVVLKENPRKEPEHPLFKQEPSTNPEFRQKWNLPAQTPSIYFDQSAYYSYNSQR